MNCTTCKSEIGACADYWWNTVTGHVFCREQCVAGPIGVEKRYRTESRRAQRAATTGARTT